MKQFVLLSQAHVDLQALDLNKFSNITVIFPKHEQGLKAEAKCGIKRENMTKNNLILTLVTFKKHMTCS